MCRISEFQKMLDSSYAGIGLLIDIKFSLAKWSDTRQKIIQNRSQKTQPASVWNVIITKL